MEQLYELFGIDKVEEFRTKLDELKKVPGSMISILNEAQEMFGYIPEGNWGSLNGDFWHRDLLFAL